MNSKSLASILPWRGWLDDGVVDLRFPGLMVAYALTGKSSESNAPEDLWNASRQLANAAVYLRHGDMIQVIFHRDAIDEPPAKMYVNRVAELMGQELHEQYRGGSYQQTDATLYLTHKFDSATKGIAQEFLFATDSARPARLELVREEVLKRFENFEDAALAGMGLRRLSSQELWDNLNRTVNYRKESSLLPVPEMRLNQLIGWNYFFGGQAPGIGGWHLRPISILVYPSEGTRPQILAELLEDEGGITISARFICMDHEEAVKALNKQLTYLKQAETGGLWSLVKSILWGKRDVVVEEIEDEDAPIDPMTEVQLAKRAAEANVSFGAASITVIIRDEDPERADLRVRDMLQRCIRAKLIARWEREYPVEAIYGSYPGDFTHNAWRPLVPIYAWADMVLPKEYWTNL